MSSVPESQLPDSRILFLINSIPDERNRTRYQHVKSLVEEYDVQLITQGEIPPEIEQHVTSWTSFEDQFRDISFLFFPFWLIFSALKADCDLVVTAPNNIYLISGWAKSKSQNMPWVADIWDDPYLPVDSYAREQGIPAKGLYLYHRLLFQFGRRALPQADLVVASIHPGILSKYDIDGSKLGTLTNGVARGIVEGVRPEKFEDRVIITYVGSIAPVRGIVKHINSIDSCAGTDKIELHLVGEIDPRTEERIRSEITNIDVKIHGRLSHAKTLSIVAGSDITLCLINSMVENYRHSYPIKVFEYAYFGTAIIASDFPGIRTILTDETDAILVTPSNQSEVVSAVTRLANDKALRERLGTAAAERAADFYWEDICQQYVQAVGSVVKPSAMSSEVE